MTPAARVQAAIEVLDLVIAAARGDGPPADRILAEWFRTRRYAGSGDRRAVRELVYAAIRACGEIPATGRAAMLRLAQADTALAPLFDGVGHGPAPIGENERPAVGGIAPQWLEDELARSDIIGAEADALLERAPLDVRVNTLRHGDLGELAAGVPTVAKHGLRLPPGTAVEQSPAFNAGLVEVQDTGSQLACEALSALPGERIVDLCAGAGGKTLALAAAMDDQGALLACDSDRGRLSRLGPRAHRAGVTMVEPRLLDPGREIEMLADWMGSADAVLVDAPCSGTGTWRRNPEARWRLTPARLERVAVLQGRLLGIAAALVAPGGRLGYVVCTLLDREGPDQVEAFLARNPGWRAEAPVLPAGVPRGPGIRLTPSHDGTDGFFIARLTKAW